MAVKTHSSPFGSHSRTRVLLALELLSESYPRELARVLGTTLSVLQKAILSLEKDGLIAGRAVGKTRVFCINPQYFAQGALREYLRRLAAPESELTAKLSQLRRRPRRTGKEI